MRIYTKAGDLAFKTFSFPDGQPHFALETYERDFESVTIETAIKSPTDLLTVLMVNDVLRQHGYKEVHLDIRYLMGARMDRSIDPLQPFTLQTISRLVNGAGFTRVRILDVHSDVALRLIRNSENILPKQVILDVQSTLCFPTIVCPDKGAVPRVQTLCSKDKIIYCSKTRDPKTGALSGFQVDTWVTGPFNALVVDDICDAGGTFVGLTKELRARGAKKVFLYVTHGIFSKGLKNLCSVDHVFTTDSYWTEGPGEFVCPENDKITLTVVPISMEKL